MMKLLLLGATGGTGRQLLAQALEAGHETTALVRSAEKLNAQDHLLVRSGDATDPEAVDAAVAGQDAVLSALGVRSPLADELISPSLRAVVPAMQQHGVKRLIWLSALGVGQTREQAPAMFRVPFSTVLRRIRRDKAAGEEYLRSTDLDWTLVYPPALTNGPHTGDYRSGETLNVKGFPRVSRADVAQFMLAQLDDATYIRRNAIVSP
jgi:putative NADH-flavin reductase